MRAEVTGRRAVVRLPVFAELFRSGVKRNLGEGVLLATTSKNLSRYDVQDEPAVAWGRRRFLFEKISSAAGLRQR